MASKKDKFLESAQRFVLKGQIDKAIKDYQQVVAMEPNDIRYRQRLAELLVRDNRKDEAIQQYEDIGKHYADNCYFLKAIAIYKQIQRLNPGNISTSLTIAYLNHQQGLVGNAMAEYGQVVAQYEKEGVLKEALKVVEKMLGVDAEHAATRLKYAELLYATGAKDQSRQAFNELAAALRTRGQEDQGASVAARVHELFPEEEAAPQPERSVESFEEAGLSVSGFDEGEEIPGVGASAASSWEGTPAGEPVLPEWESPAAELPDPFAQPVEAPQPEPAAVEPPGDFEAPAPWDAQPGEAEVAEGTIAWEEEIELDLDDDLFGAAPVPEPVPAPAVAQEPPFEPAAPAVEGHPVTEIELPLDFSLELNFDEEETLEEAAPDEAPVPVVELDLEEEGDLELTLHEAVPFGESGWAEAEPEEPEEPEDLAEPEELAELGDLGEPELLQPESIEAPEVELELEPEPMEELEWPQEPEAVPEAAAAQPRGWEEIYPEAAAAGESELDHEELESHYDLGIGYKEMGMYGGAIKEFNIAAGNPQRRFDCLTLQAICYRDKGEPAKAEELLRRGLSLDVLSRDERTCLNYELAVLLEGNGAVDEAIELYREVVRANPAYQDASSRLSALSGEEYLDIIDLELEEGS